MPERTKRIYSPSLHPSFFERPNMRAGATAAFSLLLPGFLSSHPCLAAVGDLEFVAPSEEQARTVQGVNLLERKFDMSPCEVKVQETRFPVK
jgi:hypothetical protein